MWLGDNTKLFSQLRTESCEENNVKFYDDCFETQLNETVYQYCNNFDKLLLREVLKNCFFNLNHIREDYRLNCGNHGFRRDLIERYVEIQLTLMYPIAPHFAEIMWQTVFLPYLQPEDRKNHSDFISNTLLKEVESSSIDANILERIYYLKKLGKNLRVTNDKSMIKKKGKSKLPVEPFKKCTVVVAEDYKKWQLQILDILKNTEFDSAHKPVSDYKKSIKELNLGKLMKNAFAFANSCIEEYALKGKAALDAETSFNECDLIRENKASLIRDLHGLDPEEFYIINTNQVEAKQLEDPAFKKMVDEALPGNATIMFENP